VRDVSDPREIRKVMADFLSDEGLQSLDEVLRIREAWSRIVGEADACISKPYRLQSGRLFVGVGSHAQVQNMLFRGEEIKRAIKRETGIKIGEVKIKKINLK
jgi:hypothetical protein